MDTHARWHKAVVENGLSLRLWLTRRPVTREELSALVRVPLVEIEPFINYAISRRWIEGVTGSDSEPLYRRPTPDNHPDWTGRG